MPVPGRRSARAGQVDANELVALEALEDATGRHLSVRLLFCPYASHTQKVSRLAIW